MDEQAQHDRRWWALAVLCTSLLVISLDNTILNVALPALTRDLDASTSQLQWIVDGYTLVFAGLLLTMGSLGDRFGRKSALGTGLAVFFVGSLASAFAQSATQLALTRAFMGVGAAMIMPATLSLLSNIFHDPKERARAIGVWAAVAGGGGAIGPVIGGLLLEHFSWGAVFLVNVPVAAVAFFAGRVLLPESRDPGAPRLDPVGAILSISGLVALLWAIIEAPVKGWDDGLVVASLTAGVLVLVGFVRWELHTDHPMLDVRFFRNRRFSAANAAVTMVFFALFGASFLITQYLQNILGYTALQAGLRMLPMAACMLVVAPLAPRIVERVGTKIVVTSGLTMTTVGLLVSSRVTLDSGYAHLLVGMAILASGMGLVMAPATESIMGSLPRAKAGVGSAMNDTTRQMGGALGVAVIGSVLSTTYRPGVEDRLRELGASQPVIEAARDSLGRAEQAASTLPAGLGEAVTRAAQAEFINGYGHALLVAAGVVFVAAVVSFLFLPARAHDAREEAGLDGALDGLASVTFAKAEGELEDTVVDERRGGTGDLSTAGSRPPSP